MINANAIAIAGGAVAASLVDVLTDKGLLTEDEAASVRAKALRRAMPMRRSASSPICWWGCREGAANSEAGQPRSIRRRRWDALPMLEHIVGIERRFDPLQPREILAPIGRRPVG